MDTLKTWIFRVSIYLLWCIYRALVIKSDWVNQQANHLGNAKKLIFASRARQVFLENHNAQGVHKTQQNTIQRSNRTKSDF
jgi:hypothetical protein